MKTLFSLMTAILLLGAGCGGDSCGGSCNRVQACGAMPSNLGADVAACVQACGRSDPRLGDAVRTCIGSSSCTDIVQGRCGSW
jgi:hypothetical protein